MGTSRSPVRRPTSLPTAPRPRCDAPHRPCSPVLVSEQTDGELIARVRDGDLRAFTTLVERYQGEYTRFAVRMLGSRDDADEVLQDAFLRAYRALDRCDDPARFGAWLYRIVVNECRTKATRRGKREQRFVRDEHLLASLAGDAADPAVAMDEEVERALELLVPEQREAFVLKYVEELSYDEMAELTGAGVSALKMRVKRACERLRELLEGVHHG